MPTSNRRSIETPIVMGDLARMTREDLAEFIDSLNEDESPVVAAVGSDAQA